MCANAGGAVHREHPWAVWHLVRKDLRRGVLHLVRKDFRRGVLRLVRKDLRRGVLHLVHRAEPSFLRDVRGRLGDQDLLRDVRGRRDVVMGRIRRRAGNWSRHPGGAVYVLPWSACLSSRFGR